MTYETQIPYSAKFTVRDNCLFERKDSKNGPYERKLCNFTPWLVSEIIVDDGVEQQTRIRLCGRHENGRMLPEIEIPAEELGSFNWLLKHWGIDCILEPGLSVRETLRYAIQTTADAADRRTVYSVTGWRKADGQWQFFMPGDENQTVCLPGRMRGYGMERRCDDQDVATALNLLRSGLAPAEVLYTMTAFAFLSPLNHFLKLAGHEPKFVLFLVGVTGSRKSTLAALFLSFFGRFTGTELPLSFRDTANSILFHTFSLKDVLTCIDDFHPSGRTEEARLTATAQTIMRAYGDRTGRGRLRADSSPMESRPPQGNAIITAEFPPDIGESGTARYFSLELKEGDVDLHALSVFQEQAALGALQRCIYGYTEWIRTYLLRDTEQEANFISALRKSFESYRSAFQQSGILCHGRVPETVAWLQIGMELFLSFLKANGMLSDEEKTAMKNLFRALLYRLAARQAESIRQDKPTHKFIRKLFALVESGQACLLPRDPYYDSIPLNCVGYEDDVFLYLLADPAHRAVRKLCEDQGEGFTISQKALLKQLAEEGLIETAQRQNTKSLRFGGRSKRVVCLRKAMAQSIADKAN